MSTIKRRLYLIAAFIFSDMITLYISLFFAAICWQEYSGNLLIWNLHKNSLHIFAGAFIISFSLCKLYSRSAYYPGPGFWGAELIKKIVVGVTLSLAVVIAIFFFYDAQTQYSRGVILLTWTFAIPLLILSRLIMQRVVLRSLGWHLRSIIVGSPKDSCRLANIIFRHPSMGLNICGWIKSHEDPAEEVEVSDEQNDSDEINKDKDSDKIETIQTPCLGQIDELELLLTSNKAECVLVAGDSDDFIKILPIANGCGVDTSRILLVAEGSMIGAGLLVDNIGEKIGTRLKTGLLNHTSFVLKRGFDIIAASLGLIITSPLLILIAILIRLESSGNAIFKQSRVGHNDCMFNLFKFRTMCDDAEAQLQQYLTDHPELNEEWEHCHKLENDPRITRIGKFLRKTSLDELPQLINIIKGDMSLIGPRPIIRAEIKRYKNAYPLYTSVLPGLTGLWQISGRSVVNFEDRVEIDSYYVLNWTIWLDIYILCKTIPAVLSRRGAA